jgi:hypothetical protein
LGIFFFLDNGFRLIKLLGQFFGFTVKRGNVAQLRVLLPGRTVTVLIFCKIGVLY